MPPSTAPASPKPKGWEIVLDAFLGAPDRTLTNHDLGALRGVQAFHQRISDLKRRGYVFTTGVRVARGRYAYQLLGVKEGSLDVPDGRHGLPLITPDLEPERIRAAEDDLRAHPPAAPSSSVAADVVTAHRERIAELEAENQRLRERRQPQHYEIAIGALREALAEAGVTVEGYGNEVVAAAVERIKAKPAARSRAPRGEHGPTGPQLMRHVLEEAGVPMHSKIIAERVLAGGGDQLYKGKTPAATMAAQLATSNKQGGEFVKVSPGCFGLREWPAAKLEAEPVR